MSEPQIAQKEPFEVTLEAGKNYAWCRCGRSAKQPFCDGSHTGTGMMPHVFKADESGTAWLCGCKQTSNAPHCDGTHNKL